MGDRFNPFAQQNILDKVIAYVSPKIAMQRMSARAQLAVAGGYTGARLDRTALNRYLPMGGSPTADIIRDLPMLRSRSRDQMRNAPVALGALNTKVSSVVGTGLTYTPSINAELLGLSEEEAEDWSVVTKARFDAWANSPDCSLDRRLNFYGIQDLSYRSTLESGDNFLLTPRVTRTGKEPVLALQIIEADRVSNPNKGANTDTLIDGIELSPETGETVAVHISKRHPGDGAGNNTWERRVVRGDSTGRLNVIHLFDVIRPGQVRGVPWIAPIIEPLKQLGRWSDAELNAAVVSGMFSVFIKMDPEAFQDMFDEDAQGTIVSKASDWSGEMESGKAINLLPGEEVQTTTPGRPNPAFDPFWTAMVRQIGMALEMPFEVLTMHFQSSYSAARAALLMAWKAFRRNRDRLSTYLCQPVLELWLADEVATGRIRAPGFFASDLIRAAWCGAVWTGDGPGSIDPGKEVDAAEKRIALNISTKDAESIAYDGLSWQTKHKQRVKEIRAEQRDGIYTPPGAPTAKTPPHPDAETPAAPNDSRTTTTA
ncbi:phage portal protein [Duganella sp. CT11-25]|uniref:phage portal protein n=1 Tax=unclassified Duganella TaxID=2636909 RepID=UPI0039AF362F